ncbi:MAG TPA: hypothetical protein VGO09_07060 [Flavisolibacter sp.]|jgi:uncharacterized membrane protein|nr:hypothetical protein [Flavisolibacter sp.]
MVDYDFQKSSFYRAMMTGLFVGIIATLLSLFYNVFYRERTGFSPADIINVSTLIFAINLLFWLIGIIYYLFTLAFKKGDLVFLILFLLIIILSVWKTESIKRSFDNEVNVQFRGLLIGIVIIMGIGSLLIPYLFHNRKFEEYVL